VKVLLVKTSSLGDVIHALPAVTEAAQNVPNMELTWVVEEGFADIPARHPAVKRVVPVALRRWRRNWIGAQQEVGGFLRDLRGETYDLVLDSQGLLKSAVIALVARGPVAGYDRHSAREGLAAAFYQQHAPVDRRLHAVMRQKQLFAASLGYTVSEQVDYGLAQQQRAERSLVFLHGTSWASKEWPLACWQQLATLVNEGGYDILLPAGNAIEAERAHQILAGHHGRILEQAPLAELMDEIARCAGAVSVDTGLGHLATAMNLPVTAIFGATDPDLTAMFGPKVKVIVSGHLPCIPCKKRDCQYPNPGDSSNIYPPCLNRTTPEKVWQAFQLQTGSKGTRPA